MIIPVADNLALVIILLQLEVAVEAVNYGSTRQLARMEGGMNPNDTSIWGFGDPNLTFCDGFLAYSSTVQCL